MAGVGEEREGPVMASTREDHVVVQRVNARERQAAGARVHDGVDLLITSSRDYLFQHRHQLIVSILRGEFQLGNQTIHLGERDQDGHSLRDSVANTALGIHHYALHSVHTDDTAVTYTQTYS